MRHLAVAVCAGLLLGLLPASALGFDPANLDQENIPGGTDKSAPAEVLLCQTFTAGKSGTLVEVDLDIAGHGEPLATVEIRATDPATGLPTGGPLATSSADYSVDGRTWVPIPWPVEFGDQHSYDIGPCPDTILVTVRWGEGAAIYAVIPNSR